MVKAHEEKQVMEEISDDEEVEEEMEEVKYLEIPVRDEHGRTSDEVIEIPISDLPPVDDLLGVLQAEQADLPRWLNFAVEYYRQNRLAEFERILEEGCSPEVESYYQKDPNGRLVMLNALAAYKITLAQASISNNSTYLTDAVDLFNRADQIDDTKGITLVNKGIMMLVRGDNEKALVHFNTALEFDPTNLLAKLGRAAMLYKKRHFKEARDQYKKAIRDHPGCNPGVRVNLGLCFYELGAESRAVECFERTLDLDEDNVNALVALAVIELGRAQRNVSGGVDTQLSQRAMGRLRKAFDLQSNNSLVLTHLANHFFFAESEGKRDYSRIENLARKAYKNTDNPRIRAEAAYILGRNFHEQGDFTSAKDFYDRSLKHWPAFTLSQFAKAQMMLFESEKQLAGASGKKSGSSDEKRKQKIDQTRFKACDVFEKLLKDPTHKNDRDCNVFAAWTMVRMNRKQQAMNLLKHVTQLYPTDTEAWLEQARVQQKEDALSQTKKSKREALRAYTKAAKGMLPIPPPLIYNNIGTLQYELSDVKDALATFQEALDKHGANLEQEDSITLRFNMARVLEDIGDFDEAEAIYLKLIQETKGLYSNATLRIGCIAELHGDLVKALEYYTEASKYPFYKDDAFVMLGKLAQKKGELKRAKEWFMKVGDKHRPDSYCKLSLANIAIEAISGQKPESDEFKQGVDYARDWYRRILERNHGNIFATNGLANCMALSDSKKEARSTWERLREPDDALTASVWLNLGHLAIEEERYDSALSLYQQCMKRFSLDNDSKMHMYLANTYYNLRNYEQTKSELLRAIHLDPFNLEYRLNLATFLCDSGAHDFENREKITPEIANRAVSGFHIAKDMFEWLANVQLKGTTGTQKESNGTSAKGKYFLQEPRSPKGTPSAANRTLFDTFFGSRDDATTSARAKSDRRAVSLRAPKTDGFNFVNRAVTGVANVSKLLEKSNEHMQFALKKAEYDQQQRAKLNEENQILINRQMEIEREKREAEEASRKEKEKIVSEQARLHKEVIEEWKQKSFAEKEDKQKKKAGGGKKSQKGKGKKAAQKENDFVVQSDDDSSGSGSGSSSDDSADEFDPNARQEPKTSKKAVESGQSDNEEEEEEMSAASSSDDMFDSEDSDDNTKKSKKKKKKSKESKKKSGKAHNSVSRKRKTFKKKHASDSDSGDDDGIEKAAEPDQVPATETSEPAKKKNKIIESDDEAEAEFD